MRELALQAKSAARTLASTSTADKNAVLLELARLIDAHRGEILAANAADMEEARGAGLSESKLKRLALSSSAVEQLAVGIRQVAALPDPVGAITRDSQVPSGLRVRKTRIPLGVIAMIYEARPGVTVDAFSLCFKAGNACLLKGGREASRSNAALLELAHAALRSRGLPAACVGLITTSDREQIKELISLTGVIDLVIPRGGVELIRFVAQHAKVPTIQHFQGVCHIYIDQAADLEKALRVCVTAKTSAPAACNAAECLLIHREIAKAFVPRLGEALHAAGVELRGDAEIRELTPHAKPAAAEDFGAEFLDLIIAAKVVGGVEEAIEHIARFGSDHTEAVLSKDEAVQARFIAGVQSSCVVVNASTRFNDGFQLGLGAEIGISTSRIHAYGPMGLEELTTQRYLVEGEYQTR